jgi:hypothetical protein
LNIKKLLKTIENPGIIFTGEIVEHGTDLSMWECLESEICFHGSGRPQDLLNADGSKNHEKIRKEIEDTKSKVFYLIDKLTNLWKTNKEQLYIMTLNYGDNEFTISDIEALHNILQRKTKYYSMLIIAEENQYDHYKCLNNTKNNLYIRKIHHFSPRARVTDIKSSDLPGWNKIFCEFQLKTPSKNPDYSTIMKHWMTLNGEQNIPAGRL